MGILRGHEPRSLASVCPVVNAIGSPRTTADRCPGALRLHEAADGPLARIRVPGGVLSIEQVDTLAAAAAELGDGRLHLTARGNVELRAVRDADALSRRLDSAGLLPAPSHERARNIVLSPLAGLDGAGHWPAGLDATQAVRGTDAALLAAPELAALSGRFLFGIDDGRGDVLALEPDLAAVLLEPEAERTEPLARLLVGESGGPAVRLTDIPAALVAAAGAFLDHTRTIPEGAWRIDDLPDARAAIDLVHAAIARAVPTWDTGAPTPPRDARGTGPRPGLHTHPDTGATTLVAALPLGTADAEAWLAAAMCAAYGDSLVRTTPWRGFVLAGMPVEAAAATAARLTASGLVADPDDAWVGLGACTGLPGCAKSRADVRADATKLRERLAQRPDRDMELPLHLCGCERRCGHPRTEHVEAVATGDRRYVVARVGAHPHETDTGAPLAGRHTSGRGELTHAVIRANTRSTA